MTAAGALKRMLVLLAAATVSGCVGGGINVSYWMPDLSAEMLVAGGGLPGDRVDLQDGLGVEDDGSVPVERVWLQVGTGRYEFGRWDLSVSGTATVGAGFDFDGRTYLAGDAVDTSLDVEVWRFAYLFCPKLGKLKAGAGLGLQWWDVEAALENSTQGFTGDYDEQYPIPVLTARFEGPFNRFVSGFAEADWMDLGLDDVTSRLLDFRAGFRFSAVELVAATVAYRSMRADVEVDDDTTDFDFDGVTITVETWW